MPIERMLLLGVLAGALALGVRAASVWIYRKWFRQGLVADAALHYAIISTLREQGRYDGVPAFLMSAGPDRYPILFHRYAALFPDAVLQRKPWLPNLIVFAVSFALFGAFLAHLDATHLYLPSPAFELLAGAVFLGAISTLVLNGNAVLYIGLSERLPARLLTAWYFAGLLAGVAFNEPLYLTGAALAGALGLMCSMFGRQAIAFVTPLFALLALDARPLVVLAVAALGALVLDRRYFVEGLRQTRGFVAAYIKHSKRSRWVKPNLSRFVDWGRVLGRGTPYSQRIEELQTREPTRLAMQYPELVAALVLTVAGGSTPLSAPFLALLIATLVVYVATATPWLNHFGESARYVEYCLPLATPVVVAAAALTAPPAVAVPVLVALFAFNALMLAWNLYLWRMQSYPAADTLGAFTLSAGLAPGDTVYPIPFTFGAPLWTRVPGIRAIMCQGCSITPELYEKFCDEPPMLKKAWDGLFREFGVTHVVASVYTLDAMKRMLGWSYDFSRLEKLAETDEYVAYRVST